MLAISDLVCWSRHLPIICVGNLTACILLAVTVVPELFLLLVRLVHVWYPAPEMLRQKQRTMGLKAAWATQWVWDKPEVRRESLSPGCSHVRVLGVCCLVRRLWSKKKHRDSVALSNKSLCCFADDLLYQFLCLKNHNIYLLIYSCFPQLFYKTS